MSKHYRPLLDLPVLDELTLGSELGNGYLIPLANLPENVSPNPLHFDVHFLLKHPLAIHADPKSCTTEDENCCRVGID